MNKPDARSLNPSTQNYLRQQAIRLRAQGKRVSEIATYLGVHRATVSDWWRADQQVGETALHQQPRGIKLVGTEYGEIKRMYVRPQLRGLGFAKLMLNHLADYAHAHNITLLRLETGIQQREAIGLYERLGFYRILPFGPYTDDPLSLCYEKRLTS